MQRAFACVPVLCFLLASACGEPAPLPSYGEVPPFSLRDQRAAAVSREALAGKVFVTDFIFTSCPDVCPLLTQQMAGLRKKLPEHPDLAFVSISVDPEHDTPEKLREFAELRGADHANWYFLTGEIDEVKRVVTTGFKQAMEARPEPGRPRNVLHGTHFVLVDRGGQMRGFFRTDEAGLAELEAAVKRLLSERGSS